MFLGKFPVPGQCYNLDDSRARAYCACSRCGWGLFRHFYSPLSLLSSFSLSLETARYRLNYCLKGVVNPKTTNQPTSLKMDSYVKEQIKGRFYWFFFFAKSTKNIS